MPSEKLLSYQEIGDSDHESLWHAFKSGDRNAFSKIYNEHVDFLYNYGRQIVNDGSFIEDVIQDLFIYLWNSRDRLSDVHSIRYYLLKAFRRDLLKTIKKQRNKQSNLFSIDIESFGMVECVQDELISSQEEREKIEIIRKAVNQFTGRQKEILYLKFYQALSYEEIARVLDLDLKYVYNTASKAYKNLREHLTPAARNFSFK
ncbi:MAG: RNA polymerase sigma factor [Bacteroidota bacterium]